MSSNSETAGIAQDDTAGRAPDGVADRARDNAPERAAEATGADPSRPRASQPASPSPRGWPALRPLLLRLHFYAGILIAPFLLIAAVTGLLYAASFQAEKVVYCTRAARPRPASHRLPLTRQVAAARSAHPEGTVNAVRPGAEPDATTRVLLDVPGLEESHRLAVFVDPYTGEVRGALDSYGSSGALPLRTWIDQLHGSLLLGDAGRIYSELAASWLWVVALGGVALWLEPPPQGRPPAPDAAARAGRDRPPPNHVLARRGRPLGRARLLLPLRNRPDLVAVRRTERHRPAGSAVLGDPGRVRRGIGTSTREPWTTAPTRCPRRTSESTEPLKAAAAKGSPTRSRSLYPANPGAAYTCEADPQSWPQRNGRGGRRRRHRLGDGRAALPGLAHWPPS